MDEDELGTREYATRLLLEIEVILRQPEDLIQGDLRYVDGWVEEDGSALRVVYDREGWDRRLGYRFRVSEVPADDFETGRDDVSGTAYDICSNLDEPLGRFWDLLVQEDGVWWWGDGYPGLDQHPDHPQLEAYLDATVQHVLNGVARPTFPFADGSVPEGTYAVLPRQNHDPPAATE
jgi:hypothetical protein